MSFTVGALVSAPGSVPDPRPRHEVSPCLDVLLTSANIKIIRTPVQAPNANAHMERWVGTVRREFLDRLLIVGCRHLEHVLYVYVKHYGCKSSCWTGGGSFARVGSARVTAS